MAVLDDLVEVGPYSREFAVPRGYRPPPDHAWESIRQRDIWLPDQKTPVGYRPTPSVLLWEKPTGVMVPPLGNNVSTATPPLPALGRRERREAERVERRKRGQVNRRLRYSLRNAAQGESKSGNVCKCGRCRYEKFGSGVGSVSVVVSSQRGAHYTGLIRCGSVWECPVCMYRICAERAEEVRTLVQRHRATGGGVYMLTLTLPHDALDELRPMRRHVSKAWSKVQAGAAYKRWKAKIGIVGSIRAMEVTTGPSGWHPHLHILILTDKSLEHPASGKLDKDGESYKQFVTRRWARLVTQRNAETGKAYRSPSREHGVTFVVSHKDEYITKLGLADELTRGSWKRSRELAGYRTPLQVLREIARARDDGRTPDKRDVALWTEYADEMRGARQLTWSRGLRDRYDLGPEQTDLELADKEEADAGEVVYTIEAPVWDRYFRNNWSARCEVLSGAELHGWDGVQAVIDRLAGLEPVPF